MCYIVFISRIQRPLRPASVFSMMMMMMMVYSVFGRNNIYGKLVNNNNINQKIVVGFDVYAKT